MLTFDFNLKYYFITIRAHPNDVPLFEDFLILFFNFLKTSKNIKLSSYSIEMDGTPDRHLHCLIGSDFRDAEKLVRQFNTKDFKTFKERIKEHNTKWTQRIADDGISEGDAFINFKKLAEDTDVMKTIGYIHKESCSRRNTSALQDFFLTECIELYHAERRNKAKESDPESECIKTLTLKNALPHILSFCKRHNIGYNDNTIYYQMVKSKFSFVNISANNISRLFREFRIMFSKERQNDKQEILAEEAQNPYLFLKDEMTTELRDIMRYVRDNEEHQDPELYALFVEFKKKHRIILED